MSATPTRTVPQVDTYIALHSLLRQRATRDWNILLNQLVRDNVEPHVLQDGLRLGHNRETIISAQAVRTSRYNQGLQRHNGSTRDAQIFVQQVRANRSAYPEAIARAQRDAERRRTQTLVTHQHKWDRLERHILSFTG